MIHRGHLESTQILMPIYYDLQDKNDRKYVQKCERQQKK